MCVKSGGRAVERGRGSAAVKSTRFAGASDHRGHGIRRAAMTLCIAPCKRGADWCGRATKRQSQREALCTRATWKRAIGARCGIRAARSHLHRRFGAPNGERAGSFLLLALCVCCTNAASMRSASCRFSAHNVAPQFNAHVRCRTQPQAVTHTPPRKRHYILFLFLFPVLCQKRMSMSHVYTASEQSQAPIGRRPRAPLLSQQLHASHLHSRQP